MKKSGESIFVVHVFFIKDGDIKRSRIWGYYFDYAEAEEAVLKNFTDIYEIGYYNYAHINELKPGVCSFPAHPKNERWWKVEYEVEPVPAAYEPKVTPCEKPIHKSFLIVWD